jgi:hypothetical protein
LKDSLNMMAQSNQVMHDWQGNSITQLKEKTLIASFEIPAGYVNATQMCKACGKQWGHYASLDSTKAYWEVLSAEIGIPISGLIISIKGGNDKEAQGTWVHPEVGIDLAQWVSIEFRIWANRALRQVMISTVTSNLDSSTSQLSVQDQLAVIGYVFDGIAKTDVDRKILESAKISALVAQFPQMTPALEATKQSLMLQTPDEGLRYNVTELGKMLAQRLGLDEDIKPTKINEALQQAGLQVAEYRTNSKGKQYKMWHLTEAGESYGRIFLQSAQGNSKTIPSLRWLSEVLDEIVHSFVN